MTAKFLDAVEDLQKGKKGAAERLYKFVENGRISVKDYKELIEQYGRPKSHKKKAEKETRYLWGIPLTKDTLFIALYVISIIIASFVLMNKFEGEESDIAGIISLSYLCFCAYTYHKYKLDKKQNLHEKVAWISGIYPYSTKTLKSREWQLYEYIEIEQREQQIPQQYRIDFSNETEKEYLNQILNKHKERVIEHYFRNHLKETKGIYELTPLEYYFFSLHCFVYDNLCYHKDNDVYKNKEYISKWQYKCQLSEYGKVYHKLELITHSYIEHNNKVQSLFEYIDKERKEHIVETLDKNEVVFLLS